MAGMLALLIAMLDYKVTQCHNSFEALNRIRNASIDLLLSDFEMPDMNGLELAAQLRKEGHTFPIILMSGQIRAIDHAQAERLGVSMILEKPFDMATIRTALTVVFKHA